MGIVTLQIVSLEKPTEKGCEPVEIWFPNVQVEETKINGLLESIQMNHVSVDNGGYRCNSLYGKGKAKEEKTVAVNRLNKLKQ